MRGEDVLMFGKKKIPIHLWELCYNISQRKEDTGGSNRCKIQEK